MTYRRSVSRKLARGLALVGLVGTILLLAAVVFFYSLTFDDLTAQDALINAVREMLEHVALPLMDGGCRGAVARVLVWVLVSHLLHGRRHRDRTHPTRPERRCCGPDWLSQ